ncbi:hypothetical protein BDN70DRAFT_821116 [Pholiota conissans]|uniref:Uncharacterized protein n=1 Tax=Pholiota conissans TaxID=109636 RepID=A0A9P5YL46_9AGAR|nr:hypothetical protein BDN70DRAFT_821116 [Pholiota conissans]
MRYGGSAFPILRPQPDDLGHQKHTVNGTTPPGGTPTPEHSRILLVSAFFPLNTSKITPGEYDMWISNFLRTVKTDVYMYTPPEQAARIQGLRAAGATLHLDTNFSSIFEIPPLKDKEAMYTKIRIKDRERPRHSIESYAVLNAKPYFLQAAVSKLAKRGINYDYAFWNDATSFHREHAYEDWPSFDRVVRLWRDGVDATATNQDDLLFVPTWDLPHRTLSYWHEGLGPVDTKFAETSFFGGPPTAIDWWARTFYAYHDYFLSLELFVGKDQPLFNTLAMLFSSRMITVWYNDPSAPAHVDLVKQKSRTPEQSFLGQCDSEWFYYQFFFADKGTQEGMRQRWVAAASRWRWWGWWNSRDTESCRDTRVLSMLGALRKRFGDTWNSPRTGVDVPRTVTWTV